MNCRIPLRNAQERSNNGFAVGNGAIRGDPGRAEDREAGASSGFLAPAVGAHSEDGRATSRTDLARPKQGPSISYMEGPCGILPDTAASTAPTRRRSGYLSPTRDLRHELPVPGRTASTVRICTGLAQVCEV